MNASVFLLLCVVAGISSSIPDLVGLDLLPRADRQADVTSPQEQCVLDRFDAEFFDGGDAQLARACREYITSAQRQLRPNFTDPNYQNEANREYGTLCIPECGTFLLEAFQECDFFHPKLIVYLRDLCGTNSNGDKCYEIIVKSALHTGVELSCDADTCDCKKALTEGVEEQGCCINAVHEYLVDFRIETNPRQLYEACDVELPDNCGNSPLAISGAIQMSEVAVAFLLIMAFLASFN
jgi:hypothetical protein